MIIVYCNCNPIGKVTYNLIYNKKLIHKLNNHFKQNGKR